MKQAQADIENLQESLEEEQESKSDIMKQLSAAKGEATQWKSKFDSEINPKMEELEENKCVLLLFCKVYIFSIYFQLKFKNDYVLLLDANFKIN